MKQIMRARDMFLKNDKLFFSFLIIIFFLYSFSGLSNTIKKDRILDYLNSLQFFSASFLQNDGETLSEGKVYIGKKRVRAEYFTPTKILIILDNDKAMFYNYELEEDEFFNPRNTNAWFFYDIFRNPYFFEDGKIEEKDGELILKKDGIDFENNKYLIKVYFEKSPLIFRAVEVLINEEFLKLSIFNHSYNEEFDEGFFKLINPKFLN